MKNQGILAWLRTSPARHGLAFSVSIVALGGMFLLRAGSGGGSLVTPSVALAQPVGIAQGGLRGGLALSQRVVSAGKDQRFFAEIKLKATETDAARQRAPLSLVVAVDTSGSMSGEKIEDARKAVARLIQDMRDDDEVALVRFSSDAEVLQPLARVGDVRQRLLEKVSKLRAEGGTAIPKALQSALQSIAESAPQRVRRVILASDGIDSGRSDAEQIARQAAARGMVVSSLGIGLDFDEAYLGAVAQAGHGNFGFVREGSDLVGFLKKELDEGSTTTVQNAEVRVTLPDGVRMVQAAGASAQVHGNVVTLQVGSLFAGDERRVVLELAASMADGQVRPIEAAIQWQQVGGGAERAALGKAEILASSDPVAVEKSRDGAVLASVTSVIASRRQIEAVEAYNRGDQAGAQKLIDQNLMDLQVARAVAPAPLAKSLDAQSSSYSTTKQHFKDAKPGSEAGKVSAKKAAEKNVSNLYRSSF